MNNILNLEEAAEILKVTTRTVRLWEKLGKIHPIQGMGYKFHRFDVERIQKCVAKDITISRRPANVFFNSGRKPPQKIFWLGSFDHSKVEGSESKKEDQEFYTYTNVYDSAEKQKLYEISYNNGWTKYGYQNIELIDPSKTPIEKIIKIRGDDYFLPSIADMSSIHDSLKVEIECDLEENLIINLGTEAYGNQYGHNQYAIMEELSPVIEACPPFIIFHYYDITDDKIQLCTRMLSGRPKHSFDPY